MKRMRDFDPDRARGSLLRYASKSELNLHWKIVAKERGFRIRFVVVFDDR
jgi:hypothetical protein